MAAAVDESFEAAPPGPVPGFERTDWHAVATFVPGCSGKVVPGEPASAYTGVIEANMRPRAAKVDRVRRFICVPPKYGACMRGDSESPPYISTRLRAGQHRDVRQGGCPDPQDHSTSVAERERFELSMGQ